MQQVFITISSAHNHKKDMRIDDYQEWLQERLTSGEPWSKILAEIEASNENNEYFKTDTTQTFIDGLNNNDMTDYFAVLNIPPQPLEDVLKQENSIDISAGLSRLFGQKGITPKLLDEKSAFGNDIHIPEKPLTFEQCIHQYKKADPAFLSFVNHMHQKVSDHLGDADLIDDYNNVMNTLWAIFNIGGWNDEGKSYLDAIDYFRDKYEVGADVLKRIKVGSEIMTLDGDIKIVESFHLVPERYLRDSQYNIAIVFQGHETIMYNGKGLVDTDWVYHPDNIISIDGGTD